MTSAIWKFPLAYSDHSIVQMPKGAKVLSTHTQSGFACIWAVVDPGMPMEARHFSIYGTGHPLPDDPGRFIGTVLLMNGGLVWHVYEDSMA